MKIATSARPQIASSYQYGSIKNEDHGQGHGSGDVASSDTVKAQEPHALIEALKRLDNEGFLGRHRQGANAAVLFITSPGSDDAEAMEDQSARWLNRPEVCETFLKQHKDME